MVSLPHRPPHPGSLISMQDLFTRQYADLEGESSQLPGWGRNKTDNKLNMYLLLLPPPPPLPRLTILTTELPSQTEEAVIFVRLLSSVESPSELRCHYLFKTELTETIFSASFSSNQFLLIVVGGKNLVEDYKVR